MKFTEFYSFCSINCIKINSLRIHVYKLNSPKSIYTSYVFPSPYTLQYEYVNCKIKNYQTKVIIKTGTVAMHRIKTTFMSGKKNKRYVEKMSEETELSQGQIINLAIAQLRSSHKRNLRNLGL